MNMKLPVIGFAVLALLFSGCDSPTSDSVTSNKQEQLSQESNAQAGLPGISNFTEKKVMKRLYELRDQNVATYTYMVDMQGKLHHVCDSLGYGFPYGTQYSNPEKHVWNTSESYNLPQSEPNGLFMPPSAEGTWVICASTEGKFTPMYVEPRVIVSPFRLRAEDDYALPGNTNDALTKSETHATYKPAVK
jgi:hypothetical protein